MRKRTGFTDIIYRVRKLKQHWSGHLLKAPRTIEAGGVDKSWSGDRVGKRSMREAKEVECGRRRTGSCGQCLTMGCIRLT